ncbi:hypothetical protein C357_12921 [Citreicella sp. 357]|nr:hypothetical protein C357_12921 [Citreicella sp. 357]
MRRDGLDILLEIEQRNLAGKLKGMLKQANISEALLTSVSLTDIAATHFPLGEGNKNQRAASQKLHDFLVERDEFFAAANGGMERAFLWFSLNRPKEIENLVRRLSRHDVMGHYLLETIDFESGRAEGYVCLLREVSTLPRLLAEKLGEGLDHSTYTALCKDLEFDADLVIRRDDLAMPIVEIGSPTIEHILQSFSNLFGRIGIADPVESVIDGMVQHCVSHTMGSEK